jgi:hypothetical protein
MSLLPAVRTLIVDNDTNEATLLLQSLSRTGQGAMWIDGQFENYPPAPLKGVRLIFVDLFMLDESASLSPEDQIRNTAEMVYKVCDINSGPIVLALWTKNPEHENEFREALNGITPIQNCVRLKTIQKANFGIGAGQTPNADDIEKLTAEISSSFEILGSLRHMVTWEKITDVATIDTINRITRVADEVLQEKKSVANYSYDNAYRDLLAKIIHAHLDGDIAPEEDLLLTSLCIALNNLLADRVEHSNVSGSGRPSDCKDIYSALVGEDGKPLKVSLGSRPNARLNSVIHLSKQFNNPASGLIQIFDGDVATLVSIAGVKIDRLRNGDHLMINETSKLVLLDVTPDCDYVNGKVGFSWLIAGTLTAFADGRKSTRQPEYGLQIGPLAFEEDEKDSWLNDKMWCLNFDARYRFSAADSDLGTGWRPFRRIRSSMMADYRRRLANHAARSGTVVFL